MDFGFDLDDDFFENKESSNSVKSSLSWKPKASDPLWFLSNGEEQIDDALSGNSQAQQFLCENPIIETKRFQANYFYYSGKYEKAATTFEELIGILPSTNLVSRRESFEGLALSLTKLGKLEEARAAAREMELCCKSKPHFVNYFLLCARICHQRRNFLEEAKNLKPAISFYQLNPDLWQKLALSYAGVNHVEQFRFIQEDPNSLKAAACLVRARLILKCVAGTVQSFSKTRNRKLLEDLDKTIERIPDSFQSKAQMAMCRDVYRCNLREKREFQDLGSSRSKTSEDAENTEENSQETEEKFDKKWFSWIDNTDPQNKECV